MANDDDRRQPDFQRLFSQRMLAPYAEVIRANNQRMSEAISQAVASMFEPHRAQIENAVAAISAAQIQRIRALMPEANLFQAVMAQLCPALERLGSAFEAYLPANWPRSPGVHLADTVEIVNSGIPLVWVPRPEIVAELISAPNAAGRRAVLEASALDISDDCTAVLADVTDPDLKELAALAAEAADTLHSQRPAAAQAFAANVFDTLLRDVCQRGIVLQPVPDAGWYGRVRSQIEPVGDETEMVEFRQACVMAAVLPAPQSYRPGDPSPDAFVRHATAHRASRVQYSKVNAVISVMLATSMLREAQVSGW